MLEQLEEVPSHGLPSRSSTCQSPRWWRNTLRQPRLLRGTGFNSALRSRVSAWSASRSAEFSRLWMCQQGKWRRCPSIRETRVSQSSFGRSFFGMYTDRDSPSMSWKGCCCSYKRTQFPAWSGGTRKAVTGSQSSETKDVFPVSERSFLERRLFSPDLSEAEVAPRVLLRRCLRIPTFMVSGKSSKLQCDR